jgi:hypothetical protein
MLRTDDRVYREDHERIGRKAYGEESTTKFFP